MNVKTFSISRRAGVLTGSLIALASALPLALTAGEQAGVLTAETNYIKFGGEKSWVQDSESAWQTETRHSKSGAGGIEELKIQQKINDKDTLNFDARILPGNEDYLGLVSLKIDEIATVEVGYKSFRTYYDGVGGFFPTGGTWKPLADQLLHTDRSNFWIDTKIALPDKPVFHFRYSLEKRDGQKDTTIWGDTDMTGLKLYSPFTSWSSGNRKVVANFIDLDEQLQTFQGSVHHTIGKTKLSASVVGTFVNNNDTRSVNRYPGEQQVYDSVTGRLVTTMTSTTVSPETKAQNQVSGWDTQMIDSQTWAFTGKFETAVNDKVTVFGGVTYANTNGEIGGDRQMWVNMSSSAGTKTLLAGHTTGGRPAYSYTTTAGGLDHSSLAGNVGVNLRPVPGLFVTAALKAEQVKTKMFNDTVYKATNLDPKTAVTTALAGAASNWNDIKEDVMIPELNVRYNGIRGVSLYGSADYRHSPGEETTSYQSGGINNVISAVDEGSLDATENHGNYKVGVNWSVNPMLSLRAETFLKDHRNNFDGTGETINSLYILDTQIKGMTLSAEIEPMPGVSFTTKYTNRKSEMNVTAFHPGRTITTLGYDSGTTKLHQITESLTWTPNKDFYLQVDVGFVFDTTNTTYLRAGDVITGTAAAPTYRYANQVLQNADNNYWTGSAVAGVNLDASTSLELKAMTYRSSNYEPGQAAYTVPYGASQKNSNLTVGVKHKFSEKLAGEAKIGYFKSDNATSGHYSDYSGTLAYVSLTHAF